MNLHQNLEHLADQRSEELQNVLKYAYRAEAGRWTIVACRKKPKSLNNADPFWELYLSRRIRGDIMFFRTEQLTLKACFEALDVAIESSGGVKNSWVSLRPLIEKLDAEGERFMLNFDILARKRSWYDTLFAVAAHFEANANPYIHVASLEQTNSPTVNVLWETFLKKVSGDFPVLEK